MKIQFVRNCAGYPVLQRSHITAGSGDKVENIWSEAIEHGEVFEVVSSLDHGDDVDTDDEEEEAKERTIVLPVADCEVVGELLTEHLAPRLVWRWFWRHQPFP